MFQAVNFDHGFGLTDDIHRTLAMIQRTWWTEVGCFDTKEEAYLHACKVYAERNLATLPLEEMPISPTPAYEAFNVTDMYICGLCPYTIRPIKRYFGLIAPNESSIILENIAELADVLQEMAGIPFRMKEFETEQDAQYWIKTNRLLPLVALGAYISTSVQVCIPEVGERVPAYATGFSEKHLQAIVAGVRGHEAPLASKNHLLPHPSIPYSMFEG